MRIHFAAYIDAGGPTVASGGIKIRTNDVRGKRSRSLKFVSIRIVGLDYLHILTTMSIALGLSLATQSSNVADAGIAASLSGAASVIAEHAKVCLRCVAVVTNSAILRHAGRPVQSSGDAGAF